MQSSFNKMMQVPADIREYFPSVPAFLPERTGIWSYPALDGSRTYLPAIADLREFMVKIQKLENRLANIMLEETTVFGKYVSARKNGVLCAESVSRLTELAREKVQVLADLGVYHSDPVYVVKPLL